MVRHFIFFISYNEISKQIGGAFMLASLCISGVLGFIEFLKTAVFVVRIYSRRKFISRTIVKRRREKLFRTNVKR